MSKKQKIKKFAKKGTGGITLIALVVTIIVLLLLAGISIQMLAGNNGILERAGQARKMTDISQIKDQAELIKGNAYINNTMDNEVLTQSELVQEIVTNEYFDGSIDLGDKIITADGKYKITVDKDLNITVEEFKNEVEIEYSVENMEYGAKIIINSPGYETFKEETLNNIQTDDDLKELFLKYYFKYHNETIVYEAVYYGIENYEEYLIKEDYTWEEAFGNSTAVEVLGFTDAENIEQVKQKLQEEIPGYGISMIDVICRIIYYDSVIINNENLFRINASTGIQQTQISSFINKNQKYKIYVKTTDGKEGYKIVDVKEINNILNAKKAVKIAKKMYVLTTDNKFLEVDNLELDVKSRLYKISSTSTITELADNIEDISYTERGNNDYDYLYVIDKDGNVLRYIDNEGIGIDYSKIIKENVLAMQCHSMDLQHSVKMYYIYKNEPGVIYNSDNTKTAENVKYLPSTDDDYYINNNNEIYYIWNNNKIGDNIAKCYEFYYLTINNELCDNYNGLNKMLDNVKDIGCGLYITTDNNVYKLPDSDNSSDIANYYKKVDVNIDRLGTHFFVTTDNIIHVMAMPQNAY